MRKATLILTLVFTLFLAQALSAQLQKWSLYNLKEL